MDRAPFAHRRSRFSSLACESGSHAACEGVSGALDALWCECRCHYVADAPHLHPSALLGRRDPAPEAVLTECMHCTSMIETRTGEKGIQDAINQGWSIDGAGDFLCRACTEAREELIGDEA